MADRNKMKLSRYRRRRGAAATELAVILPLFITLILGCVDFARFSYTYIAVTNAARAGAAWAMLNPPSNMGPAPAAGVAVPAGWQGSAAAPTAPSLLTAVTNEMSLQPGFQSNSLIVGAVTPVLNSDNATYQFTVTVTYPFTTIVTWNVSGYGIPSSFNLTQQVTMRFIR